MTIRARRWIAAGAALAALATAAVVPSAAAAQDFSSGGPNWYMDAMKIAPIHDAGITGEGVTIAVLDSGLYLDAPTLQGADIEVPDFDGCPDPLDYAPTAFASLRHGTSVTSLIVGNGTSESGEGPRGIAPDVHILYYGMLQGAANEARDCEAFYNDVLDDAVARGADIVTMSGGYSFLHQEISQPTYDSVTKALQAGVVIIGALGNNDSTSVGVLDTTNGVLNVASVDATAAPAKKKYSEENMTDPSTDVVAPGIEVAGIGFNDTWGMTAWNGNSAAAPLVAGLVALGMQKWPDATPEQLMQSLIRNTGSIPHELEWSATFGHGVVNATRFIAEDPTQYPDESPLFTDEQLPTFDEVYNPPSPTPTPEPVERPQSQLPMVLVSLALVVLLALAAVSGIIILIVFVVKRSRRVRDEG